MVAPPDLHWQSFASPGMDVTLSGALKAPCASLTPLALSLRRAIAFRAMLEIDKARAVVNVGVGMPEARARSCFNSATCQMLCRRVMLLYKHIYMWARFVDVCVEMNWLTVCAWHSSVLPDSCIPEVFQCSSLPTCLASGLL